VDRLTGCRRDIRGSLPGSHSIGRAGRVLVWELAWAQQAWPLAGADQGGAKRGRAELLADGLCLDSPRASRQRI